MVGQQISNRVNKLVMKKKAFTTEKIKEAIAFWESKLQESLKAENKEVNEDEDWLPNSEEVCEVEEPIPEADFIAVSNKYAPNTVGAVGELLKKQNPDRQLRYFDVHGNEMILTNVGMKSDKGYVYLEFAPGSLDDIDFVM